VFKALAFLLFFPSVTFGLLTAEVFPWGILFALYYMRKVATPMMLIIGLMIAACFHTLYTSLLGVGGLETDIIRSLAAYMNVILLAQTLLFLGRDRALEICEISKKIFWILILLGFVQTLGSDALGSLIQLLVPRGEGSALEESNRGVTLLATEPARAGVELTLIYLIGRLGVANNRSSLMMDLFLIIFIAFIIKSASAVAFAVGAFSIMYFRIKANLVSILSTALFTVLILFFATSILPNMGGRAGELAAFVSSMEVSGEILFYLANESGNRLLALYSFFVSGILNPLGSGLGSWPYSSMQAVELTGLDFRDFRFFDVRGEGNLIPFRGPGVVSNLFLDVGFIGTFILFVLFRQVMLKYAQFSEQSRKAFWIFFFKIALFGSPGNPIVFIFFIVVFLITAPEESDKQIKQVKQIK